MREVAESIWTVIVHLQGLLFAPLCCFRIPSIRLHFLNRLWHSLPAKPNQPLIEYHRRFSNTFANIVLCINVPNSALSHLGFE